LFTFLWTKDCWPIVPTKNTLIVSTGFKCEWVWEMIYMFLNFVRFFFFYHKHNHDNYLLYRLIFKGFFYVEDASHVVLRCLTMYFAVKCIYLSSIWNIQKDKKYLMTFYFISNKVLAEFNFYLSLVQNSQMRGYQKDYCICIYIYFFIT